jgi:DNA topoisomerase-1
VDGVKWKTLEHRGPVFAPPYTPMPSTVRFTYNGEVGSSRVGMAMHGGIQVVRLSPEAEEVASFYAKMLDHEYVTKEVFNRNFFKDWRKVMGIYDCPYSPFVSSK